MSRSLKVYAALLVSSALASGCSIGIKAIDIKEPVSARSIAGGRCPEPKEGDDGALFFDARIDGQKLAESAGGLPGDACIEAVGKTTITLNIKGITADPNVCPDSPTPIGEITFQTLSLSAETERPKPLVINCGGEPVPLDNQHLVKLAAEACAQNNADQLSEWLRQAFNAKAKEIRVKGSVVCSANVCFKMEAEMKARMSDVTAHVLKGCTLERQP